MIFGAFDFETDSPTPAEARVVQVAFVAEDFAPDGTGEAIEKRADAVLCYVPEIPIGATAVHGIKPSEVADRKSFFEQVGVIARLLARCEVIVTFNGAIYDVPILAREAATAGVDVSFVDARHLDCYRAWRRLQYVDARAACYSGSLAGAHLYLTGETFEGAHDARVDCRATLRVARALLQRYPLSSLLRWTSLPLPGYADREGKLRWVGDVLTFASGKEAGKDIAEVDDGFLRWVLDKDFPEDVKAIVRLVRGGGYPSRRYEDEE